MTVYEILTAAFSLAGENFDDFPDKKLAVAWLNMTMSECVDAENLIRAKKGFKKYTAVPRIEELYDNVDMDEKLCTVTLPYGVAAFVSADRERDYMAAEYRNRFIFSMSVAAKGWETSVADFYRGEV